jgi:hypothetical protein
MQDACPHCKHGLPKAQNTATAGITLPKDRAHGPVGRGRLCHFDAKRAPFLHMQGVAFA